MSSTTETNKGVIRRWIAFANEGFPGPFDAFIAEDYVGHLGAATMDRPELERLERQFAAAFPDARHTVDDLLAEGDRVVLRTTARATHRGAFEGIAATHRAVEFTGLVVYRMCDGSIAESWGEIDFLRLIRELRRPAADGGGDSAVVLELRHIEQRLADAWLQRDRAFIESLLAPDWTVTDPSGRVLTRQQVLDETFATDERRIETMSVDEVMVRPLGAAAVATGRTRATGSYRGQSTTVALRFTDVFHVRDGRWQIVTSQGTILAP